MEDDDHDEAVFLFSGGLVCGCVSLVLVGCLALCLWSHTLG